MTVASDDPMAPIAPIVLADLPHGAAVDVVARAPAVYLLINPVEYHGPHLSLHTDRFIALGLARDLHVRLFGAAAPFVVGGDLEMGVDPCPGPGSRAVPYRQVRRAVVDACATLCDLGARRVVMMTFHGAPLHEHALEAGCAVVRARGGQALNPMNVLLDQLVEGTPAEAHALLDRLPDEAARAELRARFLDDFHAGFGETSLALWYAPSSVSPVHTTLPPCPPLPEVGPLRLLQRLARALGLERLARELVLAERGVAWGALRPFPGYTTRPDQASAEAGRLFAEDIVRRYAAAARRTFDGGPAPRPIMPWLLPLSLGGRLDAAQPLDRSEVWALPAANVKAEMPGLVDVAKPFPLDRGSASTAA